MAIAPAPKQVVRRYLKALTDGTMTELAKWASQDIKAVQGSQHAQGMAALEHYATTYRKQVEGWRIQPGRMIAEGNWVAVSGVCTGKTGGKAFEFPFLGHFRVARGKVAELILAMDASVEIKSQPASRAFPLEPK